MPVAYSSVEPAPFVVDGDSVRVQYNVELLPATEDVAAQYRFDYVNVPKKEFDAGEVSRYVGCTSSKINDAFHLYEQIARLRKMVDLLSRRIEAIEDGNVLVKSANDDAAYAEFCDFHEEVERLKQETKSDLDI